jgi:hypothetical protein
VDKAEAATLLRTEMQAYAQRSRADLVGLIGETDAYALSGPSGVEYQVEVNAFWDHQPGGTIRVLGAVDDGSFRSSFRPLTDGFLVHVDGSVEMAEAS